MPRQARECSERNGVLLRALQAGQARHAKWGEVHLFFDHVGIEITDYARSKAFYSVALAPLGIELLMEGEGWAGFGSMDLQRNPSFWIHRTPGAQSRGHVAFRSASRERVRAFHAAALMVGGRDNGAPGIRSRYHPHFYGAFVLDADGHNIEAVCHAPD